MADENDSDKLQSIHRWAEEFLLSLGEVAGLFDPQYAPDWSYSDDGLDENRAKAVSYLLHCCREWNDCIDSFSHCFAAVQPAPVECCGEIAADAHWLCGLLSKRLLRGICEAILPEYIIHDPDKVELTERDYINARWWAVCRAVRLEWPGCQEILDNEKITRLTVLVEQEYARVTSSFIQQSNRTTTEDNKSDEKWWHESTEQRPADYRYGPIVGQKKEICHWLGQKPGPNMRRLDQKAKSKIVWVIRHSETSWEVWFKDQRTFDAADNNRRFGPKSS